MLFARARHKEAEDELRQELADNPENAVAHSFLAITLATQERFKEAIQHAQIGASLAPDAPYSHFAAAITLFKAKRFDDAKTAIQQAIRIDPEDRRYYSVLGQIYFERGAWKDALAAAQEGLRLDPEDAACANLQAMALVKLGRQEQASQVIEATLAREPERALTHANKGWTLLHQGDPQKALVHFREALRLNPMLTWAKSGLVEALKAHNPIYRVMLRYFLWMSRLDNNTRWGVVLGAVFASRFARGLLRTSPGLAPVIQPLLYLYLAFVFLTWTAPSLFNLLLRLNRFGRLALSREQTVASNWVGLCILAALAAFIAGLLLGGEDQGALNEAAVASLALIIPIAGVFQASPGKNRAILILWTLALGAVIAGGLCLALTSAPGNMWSLFFVLGLVAYSWVANAIISMER
jgi:tetratricopeptide (TPR) repeat protein